MFLHLLRHAHAGDWSTWVGPDAQRPLTDKGRAQSERLGRFLARTGFASDLVITSPRVRAVETAEIVARALSASLAGIGVSHCARSGGPAGEGRVRLTISPSGAPSSVSVDPPYAGTSAGACVAAAFRSVRVPAFDPSQGSVVVAKTFRVPFVGE